MTNAEYLISKGWQLVKKVHGFSPKEQSMINWNAWHHPNHQSDRRGFFQTGEALQHQKRLDKGISCDCINYERC